MSGSTDIVATRQLPTLPYEVFLMIIKEFIADAKNECIDDLIWLVGYARGNIDEIEGHDNDIGNEIEDGSNSSKDAKDGVKYDSALESDEPRPGPYFYVDAYGYDYSCEEIGGLEEIQKERYEATRLPLQLNRDTRAMELCASMLTADPALWPVFDETCLWIGARSEQYNQIDDDDKDRKRLAFYRMLKEVVNEHQCGHEARQHETTSLTHDLPSRNLAKARMDPSSSTAVVQRLSGLDTTSSISTSVADDDAANWWSDRWSDCWSALPYELFLIIVEEFLEATEEDFLDDLLWCQRPSVSPLVNPDGDLGKISVFSRKYKVRRQKAFYKHSRVISGVNRKTYAMFHERYRLLPIEDRGHHLRPAFSDRASFMFFADAPPSFGIPLHPSICFPRVESLENAFNFDIVAADEPEFVAAAFPSLRFLSTRVTLTRVPLPAAPHDHDDMLPLIDGAKLLSLEVYSTERYKECDCYLPPQTNNHIEDGEEGGDNEIEDGFYESESDWCESLSDYYPIGGYYYDSEDDESDWCESLSDYYPIGGYYYDKNENKENEDNENEDINTDDDKISNQNNQGKGDQDAQKDAQDNEGDN
ncbi:hypothetical protein CMUS01_15530 [Colletotrichum musicola]|uniref:Uncharacterized protein n=1 Tax=Colletotrichum musicola TaxID=2175873 RepID=A0A8H6IWK6_9PEZI|nr:hypothetical protein CMUS01_15530 [Colletotrichum musicola]